MTSFPKDVMFLYVNLYQIMALKLNRLDPRQLNRKHPKYLLNHHFSLFPIVKKRIQER